MVKPLRVAVRGAGAASPRAGTDVATITPASSNFHITAMQRITHPFDLRSRSTGADLPRLDRDHRRGYGDPVTVDLRVERKGNPLAGARRAQPQAQGRFGKQQLRQWSNNPRGQSRGRKWVLLPSPGPGLGFGRALIMPCPCLPSQREVSGPWHAIWTAFSDAPTAILLPARAAQCGQAAGSPRALYDLVTTPRVPLCALLRGGLERTQPLLAKLQHDPGIAIGDLAHAVLRRRAEHLGDLRWRQLVVIGQPRRHV
jgi:hypothetical protein